MNPLHTDAALDMQYAQAWAQLESPARITLLHIGEESTVVLTGSGAKPQAALTLALGASLTAKAFFRHDLPTPLELETAIETVETELSRLRSLALGGSVLASSDDAIRELAALNGVASASVQAMTQATVEFLFQRLASAALGNPAALRGMPSGRNAAAVLLIVREFMHHLGFEAISSV